jgi:hypothetical protein
VFESDDGPGSGLGGGNFGGDGAGGSQLGEGVAGIVNEPRLGRIQLSVPPHAVLWIRDILVRNRIRIRTRGSVPLTNDPDPTKN